MARRNVAEVLAGAAVLLVGAGFLVYAVAHSGRTTSEGYVLHATFNNIGGLSVGSDVRIGGVKVGTIVREQVDSETFLVNVALTVADGIKLPKDTSAEITSDGLLGNKYLALSPGGDAATLKPDGTITITQSAISIEQLLGRFIFSAGTLATSMENSKGGSSGSPGQGSPGQGGSAGQGGNLK